MGKKWFIEPEIARLELGESDWIEVKAELSYAEQMRLSNAGLSIGGRAREMAVMSDAPVQIDWAAQRLARLEAYIIDWSFQGRDGRVVPVSPDSIASLSMDAANAIHEVLDRYLAEREQLKKAPAGETPPE